MAARRIVLTLCLGICWSIAYGKPNAAPASNRLAECQGIGIRMLECVAPMVAIDFSPEVQQLSRPGAKFSQIITESVYNTLCSGVQNVALCFAEYMTRCSPPEALADMQYLSWGSVKVFSTCNETGSYARFTKLASCGEKTKIPVKRCGAAAEASIPESERQLRSGFTSGDDAIFHFRNPKKQICCNIKTFKDCITPSLQSSCTAEEKTLADGFGDRVLGAFECTDAVYQTCLKA